MVEVKNTIMFSNSFLIEHGDKEKLHTMIWKAIDEGLEGLVLKVRGGRRTRANGVLSGYPVEVRAGEETLAQGQEGLLGAGEDGRHGGSTRIGSLLRNWKQRLIFITFD